MFKIKLKKKRKSKKVNGTKSEVYPLKLFI